MIVPLPAPEVQLRFGKYELLSPLSTSFFGMRWRAQLARTGVSGTHALGSGADAMDQRVLRIVCAETSEIIERIAHAATVARHAIHPALLSPLQIVRQRGKIGIATNDVPGVTLRELVQRAMLRNEAIPQAVALRIALDVIAGLHALEAAVSANDGGTALYGGLTPDSILVGADGQTRLIDPGVQAAAARWSAWRDDLSLLACMAPELTFQGEHFDVRVDLFSIGVILWEMLSGQSLFASKTAHETVEALRGAPIPRAQRVRFMRGEPVMATVASALDRALQRDPDLRYQSYAEFAGALYGAADAASMEAVAAYVADHRDESSQASDTGGAEHAGNTCVFGDGPITGKIALVTAATFGTNAPASEGRPSDPTLKIVVDAASIYTEVTAQNIVVPEDIVVAELDAPPFKPTIRFAPWLVAGAVMSMVAFATWLFASSASRTAAPSTLQTRGTSVSGKPLGTLQETQVAPQVEPAPSMKLEPLMGTEPSTPALARERPAAKTPARSARPQADEGARFKAAAVHTQDARARKPAPKLFIPNDI